MTRLISPSFVWYVTICFSGGIDGSYVSSDLPPADTEDTLPRSSSSSSLSSLPCQLDNLTVAHRISLALGSSLTTAWVRMRFAASA